MTLRLPLMLRLRFIRLGWHLARLFVSTMLSYRAFYLVRSTIKPSLGDRARHPSGARSMIDACVLLHHGMLSCDDENALKDAFLRELASNNVIPKRSSRTGEGFEKSKLSMLRKIGANAGLLLDEHLFKYLEPGRSILFHVVRLYEELQGDHEERVAELVKRFSMQGALSRSFLIGQIKLEEAKRRGRERKVCRAVGSKG